LIEKSASVSDIRAFLGPFPEGDFTLTTVELPNRGLGVTLGGEF
uniref:tRNA pseudouridine(13) synthase TruD n=1 Tax=Rodentolepis nana TaxID=102285 RepID=A0A0R3TE03_RODNA